MFYFRILFAIKQGDPFSSYIANETLNLCTKKSKRTFAVNKMAENIFNYNSVGKQQDFKNITDELLFKIKKKSTIFLIGDFFECGKLRFKTS
ncbi:MAG: hypothetical protein ACNI3H_13655 [Halarcobacter ebronensis]